MARAKPVAKTRITTMARQRKVEKLYRLGHPARVIHSMLQKEGCDVSHGTICNDIVAVRKRWRGELTEFVGGEAGAAEWFWQNAMNDRLQAIAKNDLRTAWLILKDLGQLTGGCKPDVQRVQITVDDAHRLVDHVGAVLADELADQPELLEKILARIEKGPE